jgi:hypothetical protein
MPTEIGNDCSVGMHIWDQACWAYDESHYVLWQLIGYDLNSVLTGGDTGEVTGRSTLGSILYYFNTGLLSAAFFIFAFILIAGVVYTAQDGQFLGRKWGSAWIPLRAVFGTLMLFPVKASGFCFAQYIMLMVTYIGIGLANFVWYGVVRDIVVNQGQPVQDVTVKMKLVAQLGQLVMTEILDDALGACLSTGTGCLGPGTNNIQPVEDPVKKTLTYTFPVTMLKILDTAMFTRDSTTGKTAWSDWFPTALPSSAKYRVAPGRVEYYVPSWAKSRYNSMVISGSATPGLYSAIGRDSNNSYVQSYLGTIAPSLDPTSGSCNQLAYGGQCLTYINASIQYQYTVPGRDALSYSNSSSSSSNSDSPPGLDVLASQLRQAVQTTPAFGKLRTLSPAFSGASGNSGCVTISAGNLSYNKNDAACFEPDLSAYNYAEPTYHPNGTKGDFSTAVNGNNYINLITNFIMNNPNFDLPKDSRNDGKDTLSSSRFGYACGYSDLMSQLASGSSTGGSVCQPQDSKTDCLRKIVAHSSVPGASACTLPNALISGTPEAINCQKATDQYNKLYQQYSLFSSGGWFCAGNRYLQLDDQLGINAKKLRSAVTALLQHENLTTSAITAKDLGSYIYFIYSESTFNALTGKMELTNGNVDEPPVAYKVDANPGAFESSLPPLLSWDTLIKGPPIIGSDGVVQKDPITQEIKRSTALYDVAQASLCSKPHTLACSDLQAYATGLKVLLGNTLRSLDKNKSVGNRILVYFTLKYLRGNSSTAADKLDASVILDEKTVIFLYNLIAFGVYNGFLANDTYDAIPGNLPIPPINPIISKGNSVLDTIFNGLLGTTANSSSSGPTGLVSTGEGANQGYKYTQSGWLTALYSLGVNCERNAYAKTLEGVAQSGQAEPDQCEDKMFQKQYSMMQTAQVIGLGLISGVIDSMINAFQTFTAQVMTIANTYAGTIEHAAAEGMIYHGLLGGLGDVAAMATGSGPIAMAAAQANMMIAFAHFGLQLMWLPIILFVLGSLFTAGLGFAVILPLTPFILFWAGKVAWILLFIESLLAAPLMALGIVYPDGHDLFGQSEPGVKLAVGMMLLPVLMVAGLFMGVALTYIVIDFTATGFHAVMQSVMNMTYAVSAAPQTTQGLVACFLLLFYSYVLTMAFEKCFSAIHVLPEKVLQWIGIQGQKFGEQEGQQMRSQMQQAGKEGSQAGGQSMTQGMQASEQVGKATGEGAVKKSEAWMGAVNRLTDSTRSGFASGMR